MPSSPDYRRPKGTSELLAESRKPQKLPETGWYNVGVTLGYEGQSTADEGLYNGETIFGNSWTNVGGAQDPPAAWYLSVNGEVRLRGKIQGGSAGTVAFVLPEEVRPQYAETFIVASDGGGSATITIYPNGNFTVDSIG